MYTTILGIWSSNISYLFATPPLVLGIVCVWASYRLPVKRVYNMRISGLVLTFIGIYFLVLTFGTSEPPEGVPGL